MSFRTHWHPIALAAAVGVGIAAFSGAASADTAKTGKDLKDQIAAPGVCASASRGALAAGGGGNASGGGGGCAIGATTDRFSPIQVAAGPDEFLPPAAGPPPIIPPFVTPQTPVGGPPPVTPPTPPPPVITVIESPAPPDPLPGLIK